MVLAYLVEYEHNFGQARTSASPHDDAIGIGFEATKQELGGSAIGQIVDEYLTFTRKI